MAPAVPHVLVEIGFGRNRWEIPLKRALALREDLAPFIEHARVTKRADRRRSHDRQETAQRRAWAKEQGYAVADRGRLPLWVRAEYDARQDAA